MKYCKLIVGAIVLLFAISADGKSKKFDKTKIFPFKEYNSNLYFKVPEELNIVNQILIV